MFCAVSAPVNSMMSASATLADKVKVGMPPASDWKA
jgi:hypothetical protein